MDKSMGKNSPETITRNMKFMYEKESSQTNRKRWVTQQMRLEKLADGFRSTLYTVA